MFSPEAIKSDSDITGVHIALETCILSLFTDDTDDTVIYFTNPITSLPPLTDTRIWTHFGIFYKQFQIWTISYHSLAWDLCHFAIKIWPLLGFQNLGAFGSPYTPGFEGFVLFQLCSPIKEDSGYIEELDHDIFELVETYNAN